MQRGLLSSLRDSAITGDVPGTKVPGYSRPSLWDLIVVRVSSCARFPRETEKGIASACMKSYVPLQPLTESGVGTMDMMRVARRRRSGQTMTEFVLVAMTCILFFFILSIFLNSYLEHSYRVLSLLSSQYP